MDYTITATPEGMELSLTKAQNILTDIACTVAISKGTFFANSNVGVQYVNKITDQNIRLQKQYIIDGLQWLLQTGRAIQIDVIVERDKQDMTRLNIKISARQPNGLIISYNYYRPVGLGQSSDLYTYHHDYDIVDGFYRSL